MCNFVKKMALMDESKWRESIETLRDTLERFRLYSIQHKIASARSNQKAGNEFVYDTKDIDSFQNVIDYKYTRN